MPKDILISEQQTLDVYSETNCEEYRSYDEQFMNNPNYRHYYSILSSLSASFPHRIAVLDVGCGTGRFFHTLKNTDELTGIDVSANMLVHAKKPVKNIEINIPSIKLVQGNIYNIDTTEAQFDFIYSIGVLGEHAPLDVILCNILYSLLKPGGKTFFTIVDLDDRKSPQRKFVEFLYPAFPKKLKAVFDERWKINYMTRKQLNAVMQQSRFKDFTISHHRSEDPTWQGAHLECIAVK